MNYEFENIVPWNGANDTGLDVRTKWANNLNKITDNFKEIVDKYLPKADLPNKLSSYTNDVGYITASSLPTKLSQLSNDVPFATQNWVNGYYLPLAGGSLAGNLLPSVNSTYNLGDSSHYWANLFVNNLHINSNVVADGMALSVLTTSHIPYVDSNGYLADSEMAYDGNNVKVGNYNVWHAGNLTNVSQLNNDVPYATQSWTNSYFLPLAGGTISGNLIGNYARFSYLDTHPESLNGGTLIPFVNNDIAFLTQKGGSYSCYFTTDTDYTASTLTNTGSLSISSPQNMFDGKSTYAYLAISNLTDIAIIDITLPTSYSYGNLLYIDFANNNWNAKNISFYVRNNASTNADLSYKLFGSTSNNKNGKISFNGSYVWTDTSNVVNQGFNQIRIVLTNWSILTPRIAQIGLVAFNSEGMTSTLVSRSGSSMYGSLLPALSNINLGSSTSYWNNIWVNNTYISNNAYINNNVVAHAGNIDNDAILPQRLRTYTSQFHPNLDTISSTGFSYITNSYTNSTFPNNVIDGNVLTIRQTINSWGHQLLFKFNGTGISGTNYDGSDLYIRMYNNSLGAWTSWKTIWTSGNLTKLSQLTNDAGYITTAALTGYALTASLPTKLSQFSNDTGYITSSSLPTKLSQLANDSNYALQSWVSTYYFPLTGGNVAGNIIASGDITAFSSSDKRLKKNIRDFKAMDVLKSLGGVYSFEFTDKAREINSLNVGKSYGFIAQNLLNTKLKGLVTKGDSGYYGVNYHSNKLMALSIKALLEHESEIDKLKRENKALKERVSKLEERRTYVS